MIVWKLYDDERPIYKFDSWEHVLHNILQNGNLPTLLIYEKKSKLNEHLSEKPLNVAQLRDLQNKAMDLQSTIDDFEKMQMSNEMDFQDNKKSQD